MLLNCPWYFAEVTAIYIPFSNSIKVSDDEKAAISEELLNAKCRSTFFLGPPFLTKMLTKDFIKGPNKASVFASPRAFCHKTRMFAMSC